uniref:Two-component system, NtrC family, response regulator PilR n=1 Tax=Candidatus Kentrum sp. FW TaxID=2126338 RepID=A0A450TM35_9GAMM|nr:MAG: two-component system, NtrC family, response regulator PilR [Candidatus Kentron sp. FW]
MTKILVVDDSPPLLDDLKRVAKKASGGDVITARSAQEAMDLIREHDFDLVITDLRMETKEAGAEKVLKVAKEKDWYTQVILVSSSEMVDKVGSKAMVEEGAYDYVDRNAPGNHLHRLRDMIIPALERRKRKLRAKNDKDSD